MASNDRIPRRTENLLERDIEDEIVVMSPEGAVLHTFTGTALFLWKRIDGQRTIDRILDELTDEYQVDAAVAQVDIDAFFADLEKLVLIHFV